MDNNANKEVVINQTKINEVINSITAASAVIKSTSSNLLKLVQDKNIEAVVKAEKNFKRLAPMMNSYTQIMSSVISSITKDMPEGKSLNEVLGRLEEKDNNSGKVIVTYTVIDTIKELQKFIDSTVDSVKKIAESDFGFKAMIKVRRNITVMKTMITDIMQEQDLISSFADLSNGPAMNPPNFIIMKLKMKKLINALKLTFNTLVSFIKEYATKDVLKDIKTMSEVIGVKSSTDNKNDSQDGLMKLTNKLNFLLENLLKLNYNSKISKKVDESILNLKKTIGNILLLIQDKNINEVLTNNSFSNKLTKFSRNIETITEIFTSIRTIALNSLVIITMGWTINIAINIIVNIITKIIKLNNIQINTSIDTLNTVSTIITDLNDIMKKTALLGLLFIPAVIGLINAYFFVQLLHLFLNITFKSLLIINKINKKLQHNIKDIKDVFISLIVVGAAILTLAIMTPIIINAFKNILEFITILILSIGLFYIIIKITEKLTEKAAKSSLKIALYILIISASLLIVSMSLLMLSFVGKTLQEEGAFINIMLAIVGIIALSAIIIGLGIALSTVSPFIAIASISITPLVVLLALILGAGLTIVALGNIKLNFGEYNVEEPDKSTGIKGNVGNIINFTSFLNDQLKNYTKKDKKTIKQGKKLIKQVQRTVQLIKKIAGDLNSIQKISLDKDLITANIVNMFAFIATLDVKISEFVGAKTATNDELSDVTAKIKGKKKKMRKANKMLNKVEKVITTLNNIGTAISSIQEFKLTSESRKEIESNVSELFLFISSLDGEIVKFMAKTETNEDGNIVDTETMSKREWKKANKKLSKVEKVIATIQSIGDALNTIKELGFGKDKDKDGTDKVKTAIIANVKGSLESIDEIAKVINGKSDTINIDETKLNNATKIIDYIQSLNNGFKGISEADSNKIKTNLDNYVKFVEKVNTIDVAKVETTSNLFKQMSKFSNSIKGDFDKLADSLSDKLLPVLTELKEIMSEVPNKLDIGFQNTSASIAATNAAPTKENVAAQISRENPKLSKSDVDAIVNTRLNEKAIAEANGLPAKLDELISLLKGMSGETIIVKTI